MQIIGTALSDIFYRRVADFITQAAEARARVLDESRRHLDITVVYQPAGYTRIQQEIRRKEPCDRLETGVTLAEKIDRLLESFAHASIMAPHEAAKAVDELNDLRKSADFYLSIMPRSSEINLMFAGKSAAEQHEMITKQDLPLLRAFLGALRQDSSKTLVEAHVSVREPEGALARAVAAATKPAGRIVTTHALPAPVPAFA